MTVSLLTGYGYLLLSFFAYLGFGYQLVNWISPGLHRGTRVIAVPILGIMIGVTVTYILSVIFRLTACPLEISSVVCCCVGIGLLIKNMNSAKSYVGWQLIRGLFPELPLAIFVLFVSSYVMLKTFGMRGNGMLFVGSNEVFDFGHLLAIVRSFSWGNNLPFTSPFVSGAPELYHFLFYFWVALLERSGLPIGIAVNIPSICSFAAMLGVIYVFTVRLSSSRLAGWLAVILTLSHPTLGFFGYVIGHGLNASLFSSIWHLAKYPFAGPIDGNLISVYMTLDVFVNQRHLAIAIAGFFALYLVAADFVETKKRVSAGGLFLLGAMVGLFVYWHIVLLPVGLIMITSLFFVRGRCSYISWFLIGTVTIAAILFAPWVSLFSAVQNHAGFAVAVASKQIGLIGNIEFWALNLGILPIVAMIGFFALKFWGRMVWLPFMGIAVVTMGVGFFRFGDIYQKLLNITLIGLDCVAAVCLAEFLKATLWKKIAAVFLLFVLTASGMMDFMVIKNDFRYPIGDVSFGRLVDWISTSTPKNAIFLSYADIVDPVTIAGRRNYYGFFHNIGHPDRSAEVNRLYSFGESSASAEFRSEGISYMVVPKWKKDGFPYEVDLAAMKARYPVVFENEKYLVFSVR